MSYGTLTKHASSPMHSGMSTKGALTHVMRARARGLLGRLLSTHSAAGKVGMCKLAMIGMHGA